MKCEFNQNFSIDKFQNLEQKHAAILYSRYFQPVMNKTIGINYYEMRV